MDSSTEITIMGRNGDTEVSEKIIETMARGIQKICNSDTVYMQDVKSFVVTVIARARGGKIRRLNIANHGNGNGCFFGKDWITTDNFDQFAPYLGRLGAYFSSDAIVHLTHCSMGQNTALMKRFAFFFGVKVYAGTGLEAGAPYSFNTGDYVGCTPAGTIFKEMRRP